MSAKEVIDVALVTMSCGCEVAGMPEPNGPAGRPQTTRCSRHKNRDTFVTKLIPTPATQQPHTADDVRVMTRRWVWERVAT